MNRTLTDFLRDISVSIPTAVSSAVKILARITSFIVRVAYESHAMRSAVAII